MKKTPQNHSFQKNHSFQNSGIQTATGSGNNPSVQALTAYIARIQACRLCVDQPAGVPLPHEPRPVLRVSTTARLLVASQAPGIRVHRSGLPFDDPSGDRLREWMGLDRKTFYDVTRINIVAMGFCFPGWDATGGDLPPRRECNAYWHDHLFELLPQIETILTIGSHAQAYHFQRLGLVYSKSARVAETVRAWRTYNQTRPRIFPLPHPSWRNSGWLKRNPWFEEALIPELRAIVAEAII